MFGVDAFSSAQINRLRSDTFTSSSSNDGANKIRMNASSSSSDSDNKSLFEQAFGAKLQFPWDDDDDPTLSTTKSNSPQNDVVAPPKQRKPRVPRYHSALQVDLTPPVDTEKSQGKSDGDIDNYVQSAITAAKEMSVNGNTNKQEVAIKQNNTSEKEPDRGNRDPRLGILLIDHGSKRKASNEHLHSIAKKYHSSLLNDNDGIDNIIVKAAHMEIAEPSILTTLRQLIIEEKVTKVVCVPYFLSPGKHATIDVPNLIAGAIQLLGEERLLDYDGGVVEITSSKALGTNVESMLGVVDVLVETALEGGGEGGAFHLQRNDNNNGETIIDTSSQDDEIHKYVNRVTLLERMLQVKIDELKTMTNRVTVLEDVAQKLQSKLKTEQQNMIEQQLTDKEEANAQMANLTNTIDSLAQEKSSLDAQIKELTLQQQHTEKCHNTTVAKLENEIQLQIEEADEQQQKLVEMSGKEEEEMNQKVQDQEQKALQLQKQLTDLLDAYNELEQLQADTDVVVLEYKDQLKKAREMFYSELTVEKERKEDFKVKWNELQLQLEEGMDESTKFLEEKEAEYESLLKAERKVSGEWKDKWEVLSKKQAINTTASTNMTERSDAEWNAQLKEATAASTETIQGLTLKLQQQQQDYESNVSRKEEQQAQLQEYLQAELQTYYKTIQNQTAQLDSYKIELAEMEAKHKESMLIATNSVEASQKREVDMLNAIEELESELSTVTKEKEDGEKMLKNLQVQLDELEKNAAQTVPLPTLISSGDEDYPLEDLKEESKQDLSKIVEQLQSQVQALASEIRAKEDDKESKEDQSVVTGHETKVTSSRSKRWRRRILRPWTMFRRNV